MLGERIARFSLAGRLNPAEALVVVGRGALLLSAALAGWHAYRIFYYDRYAFDDTLPWYAFAYLLLFAGAANRALLDIATWPRRALAYLRAHPLEMALLAGVLALGVFAHVWRYGTLPPSNFLCCEEGINAGVASTIEAGARPLAYPLVRYPTAFGLWAFGGNTNGLRLPFVFFGIAAIVPFYLLMRELVRPPVALFATAVFASVHSLGDTSTHFQPGIFASVCLAFALVRGMKTGNALWWIPVGFLAALLSYEYESFKVVPLAAAVFVALALLWRLLWPLAGPRVMAARGWELARRGALPAAVFVLAIGIAITPMMARRYHGEHIYISSFNRQQAGRTATGFERYLSPKWESQLKWVAQIYVPFMQPTFPKTGSIDARGVIDRGTSVLLLGGVLAALLSFWRPWRALFLTWFVGASVALPLLVQNFGAWKAVPFVVPGVVLIGLLADDVWSLVQRWRAALLPALVIGLLFAGGFVFTANVLIQRANATDPGVLAAYTIPDSETYAMCHYLQGRPEDNFAYVAQWSLQGNGFAQPLDSEAEQRGAWRNHYFACRGLEGTLAPSGEELFPPPATSQRPATIVFTGSPANVALWREALERGLPDLAPPRFRLSAPRDAFEIVGYELPPDELASRRGLRATYTDEAGHPVEEVVDPGDLSFRALPAGAEAELRALVHVPAPAERGWALALTGAAGRIRIDGRQTFVSVGGRSRPAVAPLSLIEGWHVVEATLRPEGGTARLQWVVSGNALPAAASDFFALPDRRGWLHTRSFGGEAGPSKTVARFDFEPHVAHSEAARALLVGPQPEGGWKSYDDTWSARWRVRQAGDYVLDVASPGSDVELTVDGRAVRGLVNPSPDGSFTQYLYALPLTAGDHEIRLRFRLTREPFVGGTLEITDAAGAAVEPDLAPYGG